jgi:hypothetical protein
MTVVMPWQEDFRRFVIMEYKEDSKLHDVNLRRYAFRDMDWTNQTGTCEQWFQCHLPT